EHHEFKEAYSIHSGGYRISIEALNGMFYKGYNELRLKIMDSRTNQEADVSAVTILPIVAHADGRNASCPHPYDLLRRNVENHYSAFAVFKAASDNDAIWELYIGFTANDQSYAITQEVAVHEQAKKSRNMTTFTGQDGQPYFNAF